ncbi:unnamed protein product [Linum tenue]|uniref:Secreted protein n=1 Tax=Linum tenue TaxID=586396 RepID=A0AAV0NBJ4_9ROSI|nr:unnamed protein product [Linum tenue]
MVSALSMVWSARFPAAHARSLMFLTPKISSIDQVERKPQGVRVALEWSFFTDCCSPPRDTTCKLKAFALCFALALAAGPPLVRTT